MPAGLGGSTGAGRQDGGQSANGCTLARGQAGQENELDRRASWAGRRQYAQQASSQRDGWWLYPLMLAEEKVWHGGGRCAVCEEWRRPSRCAHSLPVHTHLGERGSTKTF
eukprot:scaffold254437_cov39-Tisochrysis_lutea.AAC.1